MSPRHYFETPLRLFVVAGEASGDKHAALVAQKLRERVNGLEVRGIGGMHLRAAGAQLLFDSSRWTAMGFAQALPKLPMFLRAFARTKEELAKHPPHLLMLVDFGAFNVRLARAAKMLGIPTLYYCPPGSWRKKPTAMRGLASVADCIATPFPWSADLLKAAGGNAVFVGHPVLETTKPSSSRDELRRTFGAAQNGQLIVILPGSRAFEVRALLSRLLQAAALLQRTHNVRFALSLAPNLSEKLIQPRRAWLERLGVKVVRGQTEDLLSACDFAWVTSGTATLEAACLGAPMVIVYDGVYLTRIEGTLRQKVIGMVGLPNLIAEKKIVPELLAANFTTARLVEETIKVIDHPATEGKIRGALASVRKQLGTEGASERTAELALELLKGSAVQGSGFRKQRVVLNPEPRTLNPAQPHGTV